MAIQLAAPLSLPTQLSLTSSETSSEESDSPTQESSAPVALSRSRSTGSHDLAGTPSPPRYSSLAGALPPIRTDASIATSSVDAAAAVLAAPNLLSEDDSSRMLPPRYSSVFQPRSRAERERRRSRCIAPESTRDRERSRRNASPSSSGPRVHEYHLRNVHGPWATLKISSRNSAASLAASSSSTSPAQRIPMFTSGETVSGSLDLKLETSLNVNSINLSLRGRIITSSYEGGSYTFLEQSIISWTRTNGDPRALSLTGNDPEVGGGSSTSRSTKKFEGKLSGAYSWPFSFPFPKEISLSVPARQGASSHTSSSGSGSGSSSGEQGQSKVTYPIPQTFAERDTKGSVQYELVLRMAHGLLRSDSKLYAHIVYVPNITPAPASALRQLAYAERMNVHGPEIDPLGWNTLAPVLVRGKLYAERSVKLRCTLSLANPQSYTRGTVIPCHICIESSDTQALDVLALPKTISVRLIRRLEYYEGGGGAQTLSVTQGKQKIVVSSPAAAPDSRVGKRVVEDTLEIEKAVWWVNSDVGEQEPKKRRLEGEIHLEKELQPSCPFSLFKVSYSVDLFPFETPVFVISRGSGTSTPVARNVDSSALRALISHPVAIATLHGEGHAAIPFTKPRHRSSKRKQAKRYPSNPSTSMTVMGCNYYL